MVPVILRYVLFGVASMPRYGGGDIGTKEERPELDRMIADAHPPPFRRCCVLAPDRFARSVSHLLRPIVKMTSIFD